MRFRLNFFDLLPYLFILVALTIFYLLYYKTSNYKSEQFTPIQDCITTNSNQEPPLQSTNLPKEYISREEIIQPPEVDSNNPELQPNDRPKPEKTSCPAPKEPTVITVKEKVTCNSNDDCNVIYGRGENRCLNGKCQCKTGKGSFCHRRPNYYKDPKDMTPPQIIKFKRKAKVDKMTLDDYKNWLSLFRYDVENLPKIHLRNFYRYMRGETIYNVPLPDYIDEYFADRAAKSDKICLDIPNSEIDSPLNWKIRAQLNNSGEDYLNAGRGKDYLRYSRYYGHPFLSKNRYEINKHGVTAKDWFSNNINWMFYDIDRNYNYRDPNLNRFMNIIDDNRQPKSSYSPQRLLDKTTREGLLPTQEGIIGPSVDTKRFPSRLDITPVDPMAQNADQKSFVPVAQA